MPNALMRRSFLGLGAALVLAFVTGAARANPSTDFVASFGGRLVAIVNSGKPLEEKKKAVLPLLQDNVDVAGIGRYSLGRYWRTATPAQQKKYLDLFDQVLVNTITDQIGNYQGVSFRITGSRPSPEGEHVIALIDRPGQPEVNMELVIGGQPLKVIDMFAEGASLRLNQRGDYSAYLARHGGDVEALNAALERQLKAHH